MSDKVYGVCGTNKCRREVIAKGDLLILEGTISNVSGKSGGNIAVHADAVLPTEFLNDFHRKNGFCLFTIISVEQQYTSNPTLWYSPYLVNNSDVCPYAAYSSDTMIVYVHNERSSTENINYRVTMLRIKDPE